MLEFTIDFETTGRDASTARPIEAALAAPGDGAYQYETFIALPEGETIPPETSAVHHIVDEDLRGAPDWAAALEDLWLEVSCDGDADPGDITMIAHNADYERGILAGTMFDGFRWVCTYKVALRLWPDAPGHSNEVLRYWLQIGSRGRKMANASHSALHDCKVTAGIFNRALTTLQSEYHLSREEAVDTMVRWSSEPAQLPTCPIGKERGKKWADIDGGFLSWCLRQPDMREDVKHACRVELERRHGARR